MGGTPVRVFISHAWEEDHERRQHVLALAKLLRAESLDVRLDLYKQEEVYDWPAWVIQQLAEVDYVIVVASATYKQRADNHAAPGQGQGVVFEASMLIDRLADDRASWSPKIITVLLPGVTRKDIPQFLSPSARISYPIKEFTSAGIRAVLRVLLNRPKAPPPLTTLAGKASHEADSPANRRVDGTARPAAETQEFASESLMQSRSPTAPKAGQVIVLQVGIVAARVSTTLQADGFAGSHQSVLPVGLERALAAPPRPRAEAGASLRASAQSLSATLLSDAMARHLQERAASLKFGEFVDVVVQAGGPGLLLPYELLVLPDGRALCTTNGIRMMRLCSGTATDPPPVPTAGPLRILAAIVPPGDAELAPTEVEREIEMLLQVSRESNAQTTLLEVASLAHIEEALRERSYHVLHLAAGGSSSSVDLEDDETLAVTANASDLLRVMHQAGRSVPLVVLSPRNSHRDGTVPLAAALTSGGVERVIALQCAVDYGYTVELLARLYRELARGRSVGASLAHARIGLSARTAGNHRAEDAAATIFASVSDGPLCIPGGSPDASRLSDPTPSPSRVAGNSSGEIVGRRSEVKLALRALRGEPRFTEQYGAVHGIQLTGIGGIGKSWVARDVINRLRHDREDPWTFVVLDGPITPQRMVQEINAADQGDPPSSHCEARSGVRGSSFLGLPDLFAARRLLLVLDDFQTNLVDGGAAFLNPEVEALVRSACEATESTRSRVVIVGRHPVPGALDLFRIEVPPLSRPELQRMLLRMPELRGLSAQDVAHVDTVIGGHPRLIEFLDALLRGQGGRSVLTSVSRRLRDLAAEAGIRLATRGGSVPTLHQAVDQLVMLGGRDIRLDGLLKQLLPSQEQILLQAAVSRARQSCADLATCVELASEVVAREIEDLENLTLLDVAHGRQPEVLVHPWIAQALVSRQGDGFGGRHDRALDMRLRRIQERRQSPEDYAEAVRHLQFLGRYTEMANFALDAARYIGKRALVALLIQVRAALPSNHALLGSVTVTQISASLELGEYSVATEVSKQFVAHAYTRAIHEPADVALANVLAMAFAQLGAALAATGANSVARIVFSESLELKERLVRTQPANVDLHHDIAHLYSQMADLTRAEGDTRGAHKLHQRAVFLAEGVYRAQPHNAASAQTLAATLVGLGEVTGAQGDVSAARALFGQAISIDDAAMQVDPADDRCLRRLANSWGQLAELNLADGDLTSAELSSRTSLDLTIRLASSQPDNLWFTRDLAAAHARLGEVAAMNGDLSDARTHLQSSLGLSAQLVTKAPESIAFVRDLASVYSKLGSLVAERDPAQARGMCDYSLELTNRLATDHPQNRALHRDLCAIHARLGDVCAIGGDLAGARAHFDRSIEITTQLRSTDPDDIMLTRDLALTYARFAIASARISQPHNRHLNLPEMDGALRAGAEANQSLSTARTLLDNGLRILSELTRDHPDSSLFAADIIAAHAWMAGICAESSDLPAARRHYRKGLKIGRSQQQSLPENPRVSGYLRTIRAELNRLRGHALG